LGRWTVVLVERADVGLELVEDFCYISSFGNYNKECTIRIGIAACLWSTSKHLKT